MSVLSRETAHKAEKFVETKDSDHIGLAIFIDLDYNNFVPLDTETRGVLDKTIDIAIQELPYMVKIYRMPKFKSYMMLKEENDFVFGYVWGHVITTMSTYIQSSQKRPPRDDEMEEVNEVMIRRSADIRKAIFDTG